MYRRFVALLLAAVSLFPSSLHAQPAPADSLALSLEAALGRALAASEEVQLARSRVDLADAQVREAWSAVLPQLNATAGYTRTLASAFDTGGGGFTLPDSLRFDPNPDASVEERLRYLERNTPNAAFGALGGLFSDLPFGQENSYVAGLSGSQVLYAGGRVGAGIEIARRFSDAAAYNLREELADIELSVRAAYYQALFAQELVTISETALERAERFLAEEQLRERAGRVSDLDVLRAEVELENLRPQLVQARNAAELAMLDLKRLVNIPLDLPVRLTTPLAPPPPEAFAEVQLEPEVLVAQRSAVQAAQQQVAIREQQVRIARSSFLPSVSLTTSYGKQLFPSTLFGFDENWRTDWTVGVNLSIPIFQGFRRSAQVQQAQVELQQSELQLNQLEEAIELQYEREAAGAGRDRGAAPHGGPGRAGLQPHRDALRARAGDAARSLQRAAGLPAGAHQPRAGPFRLLHRRRRARPGPRRIQPHAAP